MDPWEFHPALVHFPIAFLVGAVVLDWYDWYRSDLNLGRTVTGLYITGVLTGIVAALAGWVAYFTAPMTFTEEAGGLIWWHVGSVATALGMSVIIIFVRWRSPAAAPAWTRVLALAAALSLGYAGYVGGYMVYHGATGIDPSLVSDELRQKAQERQSSE